MPQRQRQRHRRAALHGHQELHTAATMTKLDVRARSRPDAASRFGCSDFPGSVVGGTRPFSGSSSVFGRGSGLRSGGGGGTGLLARALIRARCRGTSHPATTRSRLARRGHPAPGRNNGPNSGPTAIASGWGPSPSMRAQESTSMPIGFRFVIRMDLNCPSLIGHARPRILIESRSGLQPVLADVKRKALLHRIEL